MPHGQLLESLIAGRKAKDAFRERATPRLWWYEIECIRQELAAEPVLTHSRASQPPNPPTPAMRPPDRSIVLPRRSRRGRALPMPSMGTALAQLAPPSQLVVR